MGKHREKPESRREKLRQDELKRDPLGGIHGGGLPDFVGNIGWKGTGILILLIILGFIVYTTVFQ